MATNRLIYLPLGGAGEVGMNAYVYGYGPEDRERLILVDLGVTFGDMETTPGIELIMPDIRWLTERASRLDAIFLTHAHEDHVGALAHLWPQLKAPVFARRFTATIARLKFEEAGLPREAIHIVEPRPNTVTAGPFAVQFQPISHSIPESSALVIDSPGGRIVHSGDFKLDPEPGVGEPWDPEAFAGIAEELPVRALVCDSTNVFSPHPGRSEALLRQPLTDLVARSGGLFVATTFASNLARLQTLAEAGVAAGRTVSLVGRAMQRMVKAAEEAGVLRNFPRTLPIEQAAELPRGNLMLLVTGSQGERRAAAAQLSRGKYLGIEMREGDTFLFSARTIPGNERAVIGIVNAFSEMGVTVVDEAQGLYHVSGHANRPDLQTLHQTLKPRIVIPNHGEHRHLRAHAQLAAEGGFAAEVVTNGIMVELTAQGAGVVEQVETGRLYLDGAVLIGARDGVVRDRIRMALNGHALVTVILDEEDLPMGEAWVELMGLPEQGRSRKPLAEVLEGELGAWLESAGRKVLADDDKLDEGIRRVLRQVAMEEIGKKPEVTVVVSRLAAE
jgi:ribonuclease J